MDVGSPRASYAEAAHLEVASGKVDVELPGMKLLGFDHVCFVDTDVTHVELRHRRRAARLSEREASGVEVQVARNRPAGSVRSDLQRASHSGRHVVAIEKQRLRCVEGKIEKGSPAGKAHASRPLDRAISARLARQAAEE